MFGLDGLLDLGDDLASVGDFASGAGELGNLGGDLANAAGSFSEVAQTGFDFGDALSGVGDFVTDGLDYVIGGDILTSGFDLIDNFRTGISSVDDILSFDFGEALSEVTPVNAVVEGAKEIGGDSFIDSLFGDMTSKEKRGMLFGAAGGLAKQYQNQRQMEEALKMKQQLIEDQKKHQGAYYVRRKDKKGDK